MNESAWTHLEIIGVVLVPILMIWLDLRAQSRKNGERMVRIETMLGPLWDWWNSTKDGGKRG